MVLTFAPVAKILIWKPCHVTIQLKATEQNFPVVLFIIMYKIVLSFESVAEILIWKPCHVTIQIKATEQNFPVVLFIIMYKIVLSFESVAEILIWKPCHVTIQMKATEQNFAAVLFIIPAQYRFNFCVCGRNLNFKSARAFKWKLLGSAFLWCFTRWFYWTFEFEDEVLNFHHSIEFKQAIQWEYLTKNNCFLPF